MQLKKPLYFLILIQFIFSNCSNHHEAPATFKEYKSNDTMVGLARRFNIQKRGAVYLLSILGNKYNNDTTARFVLSNDTAGLKAKNKNAFIIKTPCKKMAALSSIYASMVFALGEMEHLVAIDNIDYIINPAIIQKHKQGDLKELAKSPVIDLEKTINLQPDILFTFGMGEGEKDKDRRMENTGIPVAISVDHLEETPLARAEWIKFFAVFMNKLPLADSLFNAVKTNYEKLKQMATKTEKKPTVFSEIKYGEFWYMPGGRSCMANLMKDAGADYLWKDNNDFGSLPFSFEQVYAKAAKANYWINLATVKSKSDLLANESRYKEFDAFKNGNLYNNIKVTNPLGYSSYWETGMIYPDRILSDLIQIFHPELKPQIKNDLYYYIQLK